MKIKNLVFKGGGPKAIPYVGGLEVLQEKGMLAAIEKVAGASAGSIMAVLLALNYSVAELREILLNSDFSEFQDSPLSSLPIKGNPAHIIKKMMQKPSGALPELLAAIDWDGVAEMLNHDRQHSKQSFKEKMTDEITQVVQRTGICKGEKFTKWLENLFIQKRINPAITFSELHELVLKKTNFSEKACFRDLSVVGVNLDQGQAETFNCKNTPHMKIIEAVRISMSIPFAFQSPRNKGEEFTDGGVLNNYPIELYDESGRINPATLGFRVDTHEEISLYREGKAKPKVKDHYVVKLAKTLFSAQDSVEFHQRNKFRTIYIDVSDVGLLEFSMDKAKKIDLIRRGREAVTCFFQGIEKEQLQGKLFYERFPKSIQDKIKYDCLMFKALLTKAKLIEWNEKEAHLNLAIPYNQLQEFMSTLGDMYGIVNLSQRTDLITENSEAESKHEAAATHTSTAIISCNLEYDSLEQEINQFLKLTTNKGDIAMPMRKPTETPDFSLVPSSNSQRRNFSGSLNDVDGNNADEGTSSNNNSNSNNGSNNRKKNRNSNNNVSDNASMANAGISAAGDVASAAATGYFSRDTQRIQTDGQTKIESIKSETDKYRVDKEHDSKLKDLEQQVKSLTEQNKRLAAANKAAIEKNDSHQTASVTSAQESGGLKATVAFLEKSITKLEAENEKLQKKLEEKDKMIIQLLSMGNAGNVNHAKARPSKVKPSESDEEEDNESSHAHTARRKPASTARATNRNSAAAAAPARPSSQLFNRTTAQARSAAVEDELEEEAEEANNNANSYS